MNYRMDFAVLSEQASHCRFGLTLHNLSDQPLMDWRLHFAIERYIDPNSLTQGQLQQIGSFCTLEPNCQILAANSHFYCEFTIKTAPFHFYTDGIKEAFIEYSSAKQIHRQAVTVTPIALLSSHKQRCVIDTVERAELCLIPYPNHLQRLEGVMTLSPQSGLVVDTDLAHHASQWFREQLMALYAFPIDEQAEAAPILYCLKPTLDEQSYQLEIGEEAIFVYANSETGFMYASATLLQLARKNAQQLDFPCLKISDAPRFQYRGIMLDCARHFHSLETVKRLINQLAHYKFNIFHWHLTDDEGWRIEIKSLPQLTEIGAWRGMDQVLEPQYSTLTERHGGFYRQHEIKEVIAYAAERGITVIPEIDIPGHSRAAIKSLPEWLIDREDQSAYRSIQYYTDNVLSPALPGTYQFIDRVLEEVAALFPSPWVHIGGDEVPDGVWLDSPKCQALMAEHGYHHSHELQGHLLRYAEQKLKSLGKRMVGWEEAHHGNKVSKDTVIYSWLSEKAALHCAKQGFDVILQPGQFTYLDIVQDYAPEEPGVDWAGVTPLERAYGYEPLAEVADNDPLRKRILGIQCALWCERVNNPSRLDYMIYPRLTALAEAGWTEKQRRNWSDYLTRLKGHLPLLDQQGIDYRHPWQAKQQN